MLGGFVLVFFCYLIFIFVGSFMVCCSLLGYFVTVTILFLIVDLPLYSVYISCMRKEVWMNERENELRTLIFILVVDPMFNFLYMLGWLVGSWRQA